MNVRRAVDLATQVADALAEAHSLDLVHGALQPLDRRRHAPRATRRCWTSGSRRGCAKDGQDTHRRPRLAAGALAPECGRLHGARAAARRPLRPARRPVRAGRAAAPDADRRGAVRGADGSRVRRARAADQPAGAQRAQPRRARRPRRRSSRARWRRSPRTATRAPRRWRPTCGPSRRRCTSARARPESGLEPCRRAAVAVAARRARRTARGGARACRLDTGTSR